jgi:hypothetical protein
MPSFIAEAFESELYISGSDEPDAGAARSGDAVTTLLAGDDPGPVAPPDPPS